jgi:hypothetical protein
VQQTIIGGAGDPIANPPFLQVGYGPTYGRIDGQHPEFAAWFGHTDPVQANLSILRDGRIRAKAGTIGGWEINSSYLAKDTGIDATSAGMAPADYPFFAGATYANRAVAPFRVTPAGYFHAGDTQNYVDWNGSTLAVSGTIYSGAGQIGGWTINVVCLAKDTGVPATSAGLAPNDWPFYAGQVYTGRATAPFRVNPAGEMWAYAAIIGELATGRACMIADATNGIRMIRDGTTTTGQWKPAGDFFLGPDISAPATTKLALFNAAQLYNGESVDVGDMLWGNNSTDKGNMLWDESAGELKFRSGQTDKLVMSSTGVLYLRSGLTVGYGGTAGKIKSGTADFSYAGGIMTFSGSGWVIGCYYDEVEVLQAAAMLGTAAGSSLKYDTKSGLFILRGTIVATAGELQTLDVSGILTVGATGAIRSGTTTYDSGVGFWMGYTGDAYKFFIGDSTAGKLLWTGSALKVGDWTVAATELTGTNIRLQSSGRITVGAGGSVAGLDGNDGTGIRIWAGGDVPSAGKFLVTGSGGVCLVGVGLSLVYDTYGSADESAIHSQVSRVLTLQRRSGVSGQPSSIRLRTQPQDAASWFYTHEIGHDYFRFGDKPAGPTWPDPVYRIGFNSPSDQTLYFKNDGGGALAVQVNGNLVADGDIRASGQLISKDHVNFAGSESNWTTAAVQTTNDTATTIWSKALTSGRAYQIDIRITARRTDSGTENGAYWRRVLVYTDGADCYWLSQTVAADLQNTMSGSISFNSSGTTFQVQVVGQAGKTIAWVATVWYQSVASNA